MLQGPDPYLGTEISGHIEIQELAGVGAMGRVYRAFQKGIDRHVAVKILHRELSTNTQLVTRFHREAKVASRLQHPNVVQVHLAGQLPDGALYMVMEFLDGASLAAVLAEAGPLPLPRALHLTLQLCEAVGEAHAQGVVHRDLKPENVMLVRRGEDPDFVKVLDFGIAKLSSAEQSIATSAGLIFGTAKYISPEGAQGKEVGPTGDVYAIATMAYQMLAGRTPFQGDQAVALLVQQIHDPPPPLEGLAPSVPRPVADVIMGALAKTPGDRPPDARSFGRGLLEAARAAGLGPEELGGRAALTTPPFGAVVSRRTGNGTGLAASPSAPGLGTRTGTEVPPSAVPLPAVPPSAAARLSVDATLDDASLLAAGSLPSASPSSPPSFSSPAVPHTAAVARFMGAGAATGTLPSGVGAAATGASAAGAAPAYGPGATALPGSARFPDAGLPLTDPGVPRSAPPRSVAPRAARWPWVVVVVGAVAVTAGAVQVFARRGEPAAGITLEGTTSRAEEALRQQHWATPPGDNVRDLTAEGLARWPDDARWQALRARAADALVSQAVEQQAIGEVAEALKTARLALELDPEDRSANRLVEKLEAAQAEAERVQPLGAGGDVSPLSAAAAESSPSAGKGQNKAAPAKSGTPAASGAPSASAGPGKGPGPGPSAAPKAPAPSATPAPKWM
mgnify:CR=1 FL=1